MVLAIMELMLVRHLMSGLLESARAAFTKPIFFLRLSSFPAGHSRHKNFHLLHKLNPHPCMPRFCLSVVSR